MGASVDPDSAPMPAAPPELEEVAGLAGHLFRQESGKMVSVITGLFGLDRLQLAEDVVQEALVRALKVWPFYGIPKNPAAWLMLTAKNLALDFLRREKTFRGKQTQIIADLESRGPVDTGSDGGDGPLFEDEIQDRRLRLIFACCHPQIPPEARTALALKTLCGLSPAEIASAFLTTEAAIAKRLTRARQRIQEQGIPFEIPSGPDLPPRLDAVLQVLYLLFNEGYKASSGDSLLREELCHEAIRLVLLLTEHPATRLPRTHALLALMFLDAARLPARTDSGGQLLRLQEQDRSKWSRPLMMRGMQQLGLAAAGDELSGYHLQAGIAACHCLAPDFKSTDWQAILAHYDQWLRLDDSPVIALNRAVALAQIHGPQAGKDAITAMPHREQLEGYYLLHAVLGEFEARLGGPAAAADHFRQALGLTESASERRFLTRRLHQCTAPAPVQDGAGPVG
ncbi:MAG: polymerase sigma factor [Verrucomicrobiales bacterium]|nr:polymerase sigma factor [Verrucomicrobiales bacterium]